MEERQVNSNFLALVGSITTSVNWRNARRREFGYSPPLRFDPCRRQFVAYFFFVGWDCFSLGVHVAFMCPNMEIHVPFGFFRVGWMMR